MPTERHYMIKVRTKLCFKTSPASWPFTFPGRSLLYQLFFLTLLLSASWSQLDLLITLTPAQPVQFTDSAKKPSLSPLSSSSCYFLSSPSHLNVPNTALTVFILVISTYFLTDSKLNSVSDHKTVLISVPQWPSHCRKGRAGAKLWGREAVSMRLLAQDDIARQFARDPSVWPLAGDR